ncbi:MAG: hypothetical protein OEU92_30410 [Alphaproteobacteria bacterium]|nr:hypothetical protein [Alphaproteobacteria bacterium]
MAAQTIPFRTEQGPSEEQELLTMILDNAHIDDCAVHGRSVMTVLLTRKQINRLSCYSIEMEDLADGHDAEQEDAA